MQLVLDTHGLVVKKRNDCFWIVAGETERQISPLKITSISVTADCLLSTAAIELAVEHGIPVFFVDHFGAVKAQLWSAAFTGLPEVRKKQSFFDNHDDAAQWLADLYLLKTKRQQENLVWINSRSHSTQAWQEAMQETENALSELSTAGKIPLQDAKERLLVIEAQVAKAYWQAVSESLPAEWRFEKRSRRPALDPFNAALNYGYGMLYRIVESATFAAALDPYMGVLHAEEYNTPTLTFDLIEPFRPWLDQVVITCFMEHQFTPTHFEPFKEGWKLAKPGKAFWIPYFDAWIKEKTQDGEGKNTSRRNHIYAFAAAFALFLKTWKP